MCKLKLSFSPDVFRGRHCFRSVQKTGLGTLQWCTSVTCGLLPILFPFMPRWAFRGQRFLRVTLRCSTAASLAAASPRGTPSAPATGSVRSGSRRRSRTGTTWGCGRTPRRSRSCWTAQPTSPCSHPPSWTAGRNAMAMAMQSFVKRPCTLHCVVMGTAF